MSGLDLGIVAVVSLAGAFVKSVTGMGYPLIAIPVLTLLLGIETAVVVIAIPNAVLNALLAHGARGDRGHTRDLARLAAAALLGGFLGTVVLVEAPSGRSWWAWRSRCSPTWCSASARPDLELDAATTRRWSPLVGTLAGFSHGAVGVSGPIVALWFHGYRLPKDAYVFSVTLLFLVGGLAQLVVLVAADAFDRERLLATGVALAATLAVLPAGTRVRGRLPAEVFERWILVLLAFSGLSLLWRAFA